jgi:hypothetical protein
MQASHKKMLHRPPRRASAALDAIRNQRTLFCWSRLAGHGSSRRGESAEERGEGGEAKAQDGGLKRPQKDVGVLIRARDGGWKRILKLGQTWLVNDVGRGYSSWRDGAS